MRWLGIALIVAVTVLGLADTCRAQVPAMKGWELYSWAEGGGWRFALHLGTNRTKSCAEIKNPMAAKNLRELDAALAELARTPAESIIWEPPGAAVLAGACDLAYPPPEIAEPLHRRIRSLGLIELQ
jgi:hypothetical protein